MSDNNPLNLPNLKELIRRRFPRAVEGMTTPIRPGDPATVAQLARPAVGLVRRGMGSLRQMAHDIHRGNGLAWRPYFVGAIDPGTTLSISHQVRTPIKSAVLIATDRQGVIDAIGTLKKGGVDLPYIAGSMFDLIKVGEGTTVPDAFAKGVGLPLGDFDAQELFELTLESDTASIATGNGKVRIALLGYLKGAHADYIDADDEASDLGDAG